ncbi:Reverse transcriptase (RNA-dependent DNA polymerase) [Fragilaria crotonensis]|nr:Reverse transcriptase (RNA-dependent DNA polymerase) [Fragilaria crotonensis]
MSFGKITNNNYRTGTITEILTMTVILHKRLAKRRYLKRTKISHPIPSMIHTNKEIALASDANEAQFVRVTKQLRDAEGRQIGTANDNPLLDTREYAVEFRDGHSESVSASLIAQNLYSQLDDKGKHHILLADIVDHRRDERAVDKRDAFVTTRNGVKRQRETTQGWQLLCEWKDGSSNWVALKDARQSYPVLVAEYAIANRIEEPAFACWVSDETRREIESSQR